MVKRLYCNDHDPRPNGGDARYAFAQAANETLDEAVVRAAQIVLATGVNRQAHYVGTNHVMAKNAAFAFDVDLLQDLKGREDSSETVVAAAELVEEFQKYASQNVVADQLDLVAQERQDVGKATAFAHAKSAANNVRQTAQQSLATIERIAPLIPKR